MTLEQRTPTPETELDEAEIAHIDSEFINVTETNVSEKISGKSYLEYIFLLATNPYNFEQRIAEDTQEILDPLDQALTNVIQNLIKIDDGDSDENISVSRENMTTSFEDSCDNPISESSGIKTDPTTNFCDGNLQSSTIESQCSSPTVKTLKRATTSNNLSFTVDDGELPELSSTVIRNLSKLRDDNDGEKIKSESIPSSSVSCAFNAIANITNTSVFSIGPLPASTASPSSKSVQFSNPLIMGPSNRFLTPVFGVAATENFTDNCITSSSTISSSSTVPNQEEESMEGRDQRSSKPIDNVTDSDNISVDSSSSLDTVREFPTSDVSPMPSSISASRDELRESAISLQREVTKSQTPEEVLATRADRLKRLEEQADWLMKKMNATSKRGTALCTRLEELHETYGEPPVPPPMPDVLPSCRLPSTLSNLPRQVKARDTFVDELSLIFVVECFNFSCRYLNRHPLEISRILKAKARAQQRMTRQVRMCHETSIIFYSQRKIS